MSELPIYKYLELSVRTSNCLRNAGIETLDQFLRLDRDDVLRWKGAGRKVWNEIAEVQASLTTGAAEHAFSRMPHLAALWNRQLDIINEDERKAARFMFTMDRAGYVSCWEKRGV
jgi:phenylalanine-4-hydroxylase